MKPSYTLALLLITAAATAADNSFEERVALATEVAQTDAGKIYDEKLWKAIGQNTADIINECFPMTLEPDTPAFSLVANVTVSGALSDVVVSPRTAMTQCFSERFSQLSCPTPPSIMPVTFKLEVEEQW